MLTKEEIRAPLKLWSILSKSNFFPIEVNLKTGKFSQQTHSVCRRVIWSINFSLLVCVAVYETLMTFQSTLSNQNQLVLHHIPVQVTYSFGTIVNCYWHYYQFIKWPDVTVGLFNTLFEQWPATNDAVQKGLATSHLKLKAVKKPESRSLRDFSPGELIVLCVPFSSIAIGGIPVILFIYDPSLNILLYNGLSPNYKTPLTFCLLFLFEFAMIIFWASTGAFVVAFQMLVFIKLKDDVGSVMSLLDTIPTLSTSTKTLDGDGPAIIITRNLFKFKMYRVYKMCRKIELSVNCFNISNANNVFALKNVILILSIICVTYLIKCFSLEFIASGFAFGISFQTLLIYVGLYNSAFKIPEKIKVIKMRMLFLLGEGGGSLPSKEFKFFGRLVRSLRVVGVKSGTFRTLERESTPLLLDFIAKNIASALVFLR